MTDLRTVHEDHGATFEIQSGRTLARHYGRPERAHQAVRNGVGVTEVPYGVIVVEGDDRVSYVDNIVSNHVPTTDGSGCYAVILDPHGRIQSDLYVYTAGERVLVFTPPGRAASVADGWEVFIEDVDIDVASDHFAVFGVHGPRATEKVASVLNGSSTPEEPLSFVRGTMNDVGVTVIRTDGLAGEEGYEVICGASDAVDVFDTLVNRGMNAVPFGRHTWETLTLEAGTPLFETELEGRIPNVVGIRNALDFEKGCYVGQEVVSRVENRGRPNRRLVGLVPERLPDAGAAVFHDDATVGEVTRAAEGPSREEPLALGFVDFETPDDASLAVRVDGADVPARIEPLPFVEGSERSGRLPRYA